MYSNGICAGMDDKWGPGGQACVFYGCLKFLLLTIERHLTFPLSYALLKHLTIEFQFTMDYTEFLYIYLYIYLLLFVNYYYFNFSPNTCCR